MGFTGITDCHCFCQIRHPRRMGICTGDIAGVVAYTADITGTVQVPMCRACLATPATSAMGTIHDRPPLTPPRDTFSRLP
jgi:hypothetical protein